MADNLGSTNAKAASSGIGFSDSPPEATAGEGIASSGGVMLTPRSYTITIPPPDDFYFVREEQMTALSEGGNDNSLEIALGAGFGSFGFFQNCLHVLFAIQAKQVPETIDMLLAFVFVGLVILGITKYLESRKSSASIDAAIKQIKSGQRVAVTNAR